MFSELGPRGGPRSPVPSSAKSMCVCPSIRHAVGCVYSVPCDVNPHPDACAVPHVGRVARVSRTQGASWLRAHTCSPHPQLSSSPAGAWPRVWAPGWQAGRTGWHFTASPVVMTGNLLALMGQLLGPGVPLRGSGPLLLQEAPRASLALPGDAQVSPTGLPASGCWRHTLGSQSPRPFCRGPNGKAGCPGLPILLPQGQPWRPHYTQRLWRRFRRGPVRGDRSPEVPPARPPEPSFGSCWERGASSGGGVQVHEAKGRTSHSVWYTHPPGP